VVVVVVVGIIVVPVTVVVRAIVTTVIHINNGRITTGRGRVWVLLLRGCVVIRFKSSLVLVLVLVALAVT